MFKRILVFLVVLLFAIFATSFIAPSLVGTEQRLIFTFVGFFLVAGLHLWSLHSLENGLDGATTLSVENKNSLILGAQKAFRLTLKVILGAFVALALALFVSNAAISTLLMIAFGAAIFIFFFLIGQAESKLKKAVEKPSKD